MTNLKAYSDAVQTSVGQAKTTGQLDSTSMAVLQAAKGVPGAAQAYQISQTLQSGLNSVFGQGSTIARLAGAGLSGNLLTTLPNVFNQAFNGRTLQSDQYEFAQDYKRLVKGQKTTSPNDTSDQDVNEALEWAINKLGVPISGREHVQALNKSPQAYMDLYKVNPITSTDPARVQAAYNVVQQYMMYPPDPNNALGAWANTIGVYDQILVNAVTGQAQLVPGSPRSALTNPPPALEQASTQPIPLTNGMVAPAGSLFSTTPGSPIRYIVPGLLILGVAVLIIAITVKVTD